METIDVIKHFDKMNAIADMIKMQVHRITQIENLRDEKSWLFYGLDEIVSEKNRYSTKLESHKLLLERLINYYKNNSKLN